jgi:hypothetical protein
MMDKKSTIGFILIFILLMIWAQMNTPSQAEVARQKHTRDSIAMAQHKMDSLVNNNKLYPLMHLQIQAFGNNTL